MRVLSAGREAHNEEQAFCYIKGVSTATTLDQTKMNRLNQQLMRRFYQVLIQHCEKSLLDELMDYDERKR